jgi:hypothetical protein
MHGGSCAGRSLPPSSLTDSGSIFLSLVAISDRTNAQLVRKWRAVISWLILVSGREYAVNDLNRLGIAVSRKPTFRRKGRLYRAYTETTSPGGISECNALARNGFRSLKVEIRSKNALISGDSETWNSRRAAADNKGARCPLAGSSWQRTMRTT